MRHLAFLGPNGEKILTTFGYDYRLSLHSTACEVSDISSRECTVIVE
jgi:hypothetical protein